MRQRRPLAGRRALVTGASRGIGAAIVRRLAELGADVALAARSADKIGALADDLGRQGVSALAIGADMTDRDSLAALMDGVAGHWGGLDILVNNAGLLPAAKPATEVSWAEWDATLGLNLSAPWYLACRARELMGPGGVIVNNASTASYYPSRGLMAYNVSADPRVATVGIWNSGLLQPDEKIFAGLHSSVIIITGGESDIAYANGKRDFETMPARIPVFYGVYPSVRHGGTYNEDNGGAFGVAAVAWLKWQLMNDTSANVFTTAKYTPTSSAERNCCSTRMSV